MGIGGTLFIFLSHKHAILGRYRVKFDFVKVMPAHMQSVTLTSGIVLNYQDQGEKSAPVIILIMGLGAQMTVWPDTFYQGLVNNGFRVIRFDNRDVGLSSQLNQLGTPSLLKLWLSKRLPVTPNIPYQLEDMAFDVVQLMTALDIKRAHMVGASMGGMIAQILATKYKKKVLSLTSIMSSGSFSMLSTPNLKVVAKLVPPAKKANREAAINYNVKMNRLIGSPAYPVDISTLHKKATLDIDRAHNPAGFKRQLIAITTSGDRRESLKNIKAPTLVIHGSDDPIIPLSNGQDTAQRIRKAKLKAVQGMGHNLPPLLMGKMTKWITKHVTKAEQKRMKNKANKKARKKASFS